MAQSTDDAFKAQAKVVLAECRKLLHFATTGEVDSELCLEFDDMLAVAELREVE